MKITFKEEIPPDYEALKKMVNKSDSWRSRLESVEELGKWKCKQSIDLLWCRMISDKVYQVQEAAFRKLQNFGEDVKLPRKTKGNLVKDIDKKLKSIKNSLPIDHSFIEFKEKFKITNPDIYDTYEGDKRGEFNKWLENKWISLSKK